MSPKMKMIQSTFLIAFSKFFKNEKSNDETNKRKMKENFKTLGIELPEATTEDQTEFITKANEILEPYESSKDYLFR